MSYTRRDMLRSAVAAGAVMVIPGGSTAWGASAAGRVTSSTTAEDFTFVHLTDMHVTPKRKGDEGYRACIEHVRGLADRPRFALMGGDLAFDGAYNPKPYFEEQIRLYKEVSDGLGVPYYNCMGNHDVLGWSSRRKVELDEPEMGKRMIMDRLEWERPYYSFDHGGWHFVVLDCIYGVTRDHGPTYEPRIGDEQLEWLAYDLGAAGDKPKVCMTHIAAFCNVGQVNGDPNRKALDGHMQVLDTKPLRLVLERHGVKALLQGHSHRREQFFYNGVWYLTSPSVSGAWWSGNWHGDEPGYTRFRCRDRELSWEYHVFGWEPHLEPEDTLERQKLAERAAFEREQRELMKRERLGRR